MEKTLDAVYTDPRQPGSFGGVDKLRRGLVKSKKLNVSEKEVLKFLRTKDTYTKFRAARKTFKRNPIIAPHIDAQWQGDLAQVTNLASENNGVSYLLVLIDVVSKFVWLEPMVDKSGPVSKAAFQKIFRRTKRRPLKLQTDDGSEFIDSAVKKYFEDMKINWFSVKSDKKAAVAERVIRTLKEKIYRYLNEKNTKRYIDVLQDLVHSYNNTYHKSIKMTPAEVTEKTEGKVLKNLYGYLWGSDEKKKRRPKFQVGDKVRLSLSKRTFEKGYTGNWTEEIFTVSVVKTSAKPEIMYKLVDFNMGTVEGSFYARELQLVDKGLNDYWAVEYIVDEREARRKTRKKVGKRWVSRMVNIRQKLVKWKGYPASMNSWVDADDMKDLA